MEKCLTWTAVIRKWWMKSPWSWWTQPQSVFYCYAASFLEQRLCLALWGVLFATWWMFGFCDFQMFHCFKSLLKFERASCVHGNLLFKLEELSWVCGKRVLKNDPATCPQRLWAGRVHTGSPGGVGRLPVNTQGTNVTCNPQHPVHI